MANPPITMQTNQQVTLAADPELSSPPNPDEPAPLSANPIWSVDDGTIVGLVPDSVNALTCIVFAKKSGACIVTCTAAGQSSLVQTQPFVIIAALANKLNINAGLVTRNQYVPQVP